MECNVERELSLPSELVARRLSRRRLLNGGVTVTTAALAGLVLGEGWRLSDGQATSIAEQNSELATTCPMSPAVGIPDAEGYFTAWGLGKSPVWVVGMGAPDVLMRATPESGTPVPRIPAVLGEHFVESAKWGWFAKRLWVIEGGFSSQVTLSGASESGEPLYFSINDSEPMVSAVLDPANPPIPVQHGNWAEFPSNIYFPKTGCYHLKAEWDGGSWNAQLPFMIPGDVHEPQE